MKKSKAGLWVGSAILFLSAAYSAILFLLKTNLDTSAWVLYGATLVAFLLTGIQMVVVSSSRSSFVMETALGLVTAIYFGLQLVFGGIICMFFTDLPLTVVFVCEIILLATYLTIAFFMYAAQSSSSAQDLHDQRTVQKMRLLENDIQTMVDEATDSKVKEALRGLAEAIHFSDVVTLPGLADVEGRMAQNIVALQDELNDESADPLVRIKTLHSLLKERDRTAAILKR